MANQFYPKGKTKILTAKIDFLTDTIKAALVKSPYVFDSAHEFLSDLGANVVASLPLANKSVVGGVFDADDLSFEAIAAGNSLQAILIYKDTGVAGTSALIGYLDDVQGLPAEGSGAAVNVVWANSADKILAI